MDDGARNIKESIKLTELLFAQGVTGAVCTPHYIPYEMDIDEFTTKRNQSVSLLKGLNFTLIPASETFLHDILFLNKTLDPLTIENTPYLLLELPFLKKWDKSLYENIEKLMALYNIIPIIAHIERYPGAKKDNIKRLKEIGCVMQLNSSSLLYKKTQKRALYLIKKGLIDVLGSDCHNLETRPPRIKPALEIISNRLGEQYCDKFKNNSAIILKGIDIR